MCFISFRKLVNTHRRFNAAVGEIGCSKRSRPVLLSISHLNVAVAMPFRRLSVRVCNKRILKRMTPSQSSCESRMGVPRPARLRMGEMVWLQKEGLVLRRQVVRPIPRRLQKRKGKIW